MGKKRAAAVSAPAAVPFPAPAAAPEPEPEPEPNHFSDYGFDPQLLHFFSQVHPISTHIRILQKGIKIHACW
jgi:hypothetical protein